MGKGGGGAPDTSGLESATKEATALQKEIYEQTREDSMPWYNTGKAGIGRLGELLGLQGNGGALDRQSVYDELAPQFTTTTPKSGGDLYFDIDGSVKNMAGLEDSYRKKTRGYGGGLEYQTGLLGSAEEIADFMTARGYEAAGGMGGSTESINYEALNAAVEERLANQETPEGFGSLLERFSMDDFEEDPSYQFRQDEGNKALERAMAAQGVTLGGGGFGGVNPQAARALQEQNQNLASQEYGNAYNRYNADQQNVYNRLMGVAGMGQGTTGQLQQAGQAYATNTGQLNTSLAQAQYQAAQANASKPSMFGQILGAASPLYSAATGTGSAAGNAMAAFGFSDSRLKENIEYIGKENGHKMYDFDYKDGSGRHRGVMAQDVIEYQPDAVWTMPNGYMAVDYDKLGVKMERV